MTKSFTDPNGITRCFWCEQTVNYIAYHDDEWGYPVDDDQRLFEKICLEGFQAGLSWLTILNKREGFRRAFAEFDFYKVARFDQAKVEELVQNSEIIRHRGKIEATINNAQRAIEMVEQEGSLAAFFWGYEPEERVDYNPMAVTTNDEAIALSKELKKRGWKFVGPTTVYSFIQAMGMVNDHALDCDFRAKANKARAKFKRP